MKSIDDTKRKNKKFSKTYLSKTGKKVYSASEVEIANYLDLHGIPYIRPRKALKGEYYNNSCFLPDFLIDGVVVEYFGIKNDKGYEQRIILKKESKHPHKEYIFLDNTNQIGKLGTRFKHLIGKNPQLKLSQIFNKIRGDEEAFKKLIEQYYNKEIGEKIIKNFNEEYKYGLIKLRKELFEKFMKNKGSEFLYCLLKKEQEKRRNSKEV